jgi:hypothetical protein
LGFGDTFEKGGWTFANDVSQKNIHRLSTIWESFHDSSSPPDEVALFLNDGIARVFDVTDETRDPKRILRWFVFACIYHMASSHTDGANGFAGARGVLSYGERVLLGREIKILSDYTVGSADLPSRLGNRVCVYSPKEFQLNLAFSRAYIIESGGKSVGLEHPSLYIDAAALNALEALVNDISFDESVRQDFDSLGVPSRIVPLKRIYKVERRQEQNGLKQFSVLRNSGDGFKAFVELTFAVPEISFSKRGIVTTVHRLENLVADDELRQGHRNITFLS